MNWDKALSTLIVISVALTTVACTQSPQPEVIPDQETGTEPDALTRMLALVGPEQAMEGEETRNLSWEGKDKTFLTSANRFSFGLYGRLAEEGKDFVYSPLSLQFILGMLQEVADETTSLEIRKALGIEYLSKEDVGGYYQFVLESLPTMDNEIALSLSNAFLVDDAIGILPEGQQQLARNYKSVVEQVDFAKSKEVVDLVNAWCNQHTHGLIPHLLPDGMDLSQMIACLMNALYFKGGWSDPFISESNSKKTFYPTQGSQKEMTFMNQKNSYFKYFADETCQAISLPVGKYQSFILTGILPQGDKSLAETAGWLSGEGWERIRGKQARKDIELFLPKFSTASDDIQLADPLKEMGFQRIFSTDSRWSGLLDTEGAAPVSVLFQKAKFGIDEDGVEGAAATFGGMVGTNLDAPEPVFMPLVFDHPFLYVLSEAETGLILFIGQFCSGNAE